MGMTDVFCTSGMILSMVVAVKDTLGHMCVYTLLASTYLFIVTSGLFFEKFYTNTCNSFYDDITTFGVPYHHCISHCDVVDECVALSYKPLMSACILHSRDNTTSECQGYIYTRKADWTKEKSPCYCPEIQQCELTGLCGAINMKCAALSDPVHGLLLGNQFVEGNRVKIKCNSGYVADGDQQSRCEAGSWVDGEKTCIEDPSCNRNLFDGVDDSQITQSSNWCYLHITAGQCADYQDFSRYSRLNSIGYYSGGWYPGTENTSEYIQVELNQAEIVSAIVLQGRHHGVSGATFIQQVTKFTIKLSSDCQSFTTIVDDNGNDMVFNGTVTPNDLVVRPLPERKRARCVRLHPMEWDYHPSLRWDVQGC